MKKKTLESCASLCNSILKDELAQLVRTTNINKTKFTAVKSLNHQVRQLCMLGSPGPHPLQVQAASLSLRTKTKQGIQINANPSSPWKTSGLTGQILPALLLMCQVLCLYIYRTDSCYILHPYLVVCMSQITNFLIYVNFEKNLSLVPFNVLHGSSLGLLDYWKWKYGVRFEIMITISQTCMEMLIKTEMQFNWYLLLIGFTTSSHLKVVNIRIHLLLRKPKLKIWPTIILLCKANIWEYVFQGLKMLPREAFLRWKFTVLPHPEPL